MRMLDAKENVLYVRMLGGFSVQWNGKLIAGGSKANGSQFAYLLQILLHHRDKGVTRDRLEELLFEDREIDNIHHALQSVIYNAKKKLAQAGLPPFNYIVQRKGVFFWTDQIPVVEDATCFEEQFRLAENSEDENERIAFYVEACHWYTGEFLPMQTAVIWAAHEARRYHELFCECVEKGAQLLRLRQDFFQMEELGTYAAKVDPLADWEPITMEALASMGRYEEARKLYEDTVDYYFNEQGLRPSKKLMAQFERLGEEMMHRYAVLDQIQGDLSGLTDQGPGGYFCAYPVFQGIYRMVERMLERGGQSVYLMLCTVVDGKGVPMRAGPMLEELSKRMGDAIRLTVRRGDTMTQYGKGQYLVLLVNTTRENCVVIQKRINDRFIIGRQRSSIQYYVNSVFWETEKGHPNIRGNRP
ncbi:MAG: BTAD domain-containing putative transcriptional regulator [Eubacteriales bacterium]|nr:BTAD domain-containing putative transcriptional regulator [Eubacteriales bacterium]